MTYLFVFCALFVLDFVWARYTRATSNGEALKAAAYAVGTIVLSGAAAIGYTSNHWLLIPAGAGAFCGTYCSLKVMG